MAMSISREVIALQEELNYIYNVRADALSVELLPKIKGIRGFTVRFIIKAATVWDALSGAVVNWYDRAIDIVRKVS